MEDIVTAALETLAARIMVEVSGNRTRTLL